ncbi:MAG TPA: DNA repair protein RadC [Bacillota bacterium]
MSGPSIKNLPLAERPRERLERFGAEYLSNAELLAILLRTGAKDLSALDLAEVLLAKFRTLTELSATSVKELCAVKGIGSSKAVQLLAAFELGRRLYSAKPETMTGIKSPKDVADLLMAKLRFLKHERFLAVHLNTKNKVLSIETISIGTLDSSLVHPRELFKTAIKNSSAALILAHNHPSGDPYPSKEDLTLTRRLREGGEILGIQILDHIIIGDNRYVSLREEGFF